MRIIVMSDSHRCYSAVEKIVSRNLDADMFIHLGDGESDVDTVILKFPQIADKFIHVCGNCDFNSFSPNYSVIPVENHKIYACHGHREAVKYSLEILKKTAALHECDIILYGHTHVRHNEYEDGSYIFNPGSASKPNDGNKPSFGCIEITPSGVVTNIADI